MTIERNRPWGEPVTRPDDLVVATSDADLAALIAGDATRPLGVAGGDLYHSIGSPPIGRRDASRLPIDVLEVEVDDVEVLAAAHVVARRGWWRGTIVAVCNVDRVGAWDVAPRAHPNDGRFDVVEVAPTMTLRQRWQARSRLRTGTHVPHPQISTGTGTDRTWTFDRPHAVWADGRRVADARRLRVRLRPDAVDVIA